MLNGYNVDFDVKYLFDMFFLLDEDILNRVWDCFGVMYYFKVRDILYEYLEWFCYKVVIEKNGSFYDILIEDFFKVLLVMLVIYLDFFF